MTVLCSRQVSSSVNNFHLYHFKSPLFLVNPPPHSVCAKYKASFITTSQAVKYGMTPFNV